MTFDHICGAGAATNESVTTPAAGHVPALNPNVSGIMPKWMNGRMNTRMDDSLIETASIYEDFEKT